MFLKRSAIVLAQRVDEMMELCNSRNSGGRGINYRVTPMADFGGLEKLHAQLVPLQVCRLMFNTYNP
jgi:hypothetical protein